MSWSKAPGFDGFQLERVRHAESGGHAKRVALHAADVAVRDLILRVDRDREHLDRGAGTGARRPSTCRCASSTRLDASRYAT